MRSPISIGLLTLFLVALTVWGLPRPDDDHLSIRDSTGFGAWFDGPQQVQPLYQTHKASTVGPRHTWRVDTAASDVAIEVLSNTGSTHLVPLQIWGAVVVDTRNLDLTRGVLHAKAADHLGIEMPEATVEILESHLGTAPRKVGTKAMGDGRIRIRTHHAAVDMAVGIEVQRIEEDVLRVSLSDFEGFDFPDLGLNPGFAELTIRFGVESLEDSGAIRLSLVLRRVP